MTNNNEQAPTLNCTCCGEQPVTSAPQFFDDRETCEACDTEHANYDAQRLQLERVLLRWARRQNIGRHELACMIEAAGIGAAERIKKDAGVN